MKMTKGISAVGCCAMALASLVTFGPLASQARAGITAQFTGGAIFVNGSSSSPEGTNNAQAKGTVAPSTATGSGSTSSGLVSASIDMVTNITTLGSTTRVTVAGNGIASQPAGYAGSANISVETANPDFSNAPLILTISEEAIFTITTTEGFDPVIFTAGTGQIVGNHLLPGTYEIDMFFGVFLSEGQTSTSINVNWELAMTPVPAPATALVMLGAMMPGRRRRRR